MHIKLWYRDEFTFLMMATLIFLLQVRSFTPRRPVSPPALGAKPLSPLASGEKPLSPPTLGK